MAQTIVLVLGVWQLVVAIISIFLFGFSIQGYRAKRNPISKTLLISFALFMVAMIFQVIGFFDDVVFTLQPNNPIEEYLYYQIGKQQIAYYFLILGIFSMYIFSMYIMRTENTLHKNDLFAMIFAIIIIVFGLIKQFILVGPMDELTKIITGIDIYVVFYSLILISPMIKESMKLVKRIDKNDEAYKKIQYLVVLSWCFLGTILCLVLETVYSVIMGISYNIFSFLAWGLASIGLLSAYFALYHKPKSKANN